MTVTRGRTRVDAASTLRFAHTFFDGFAPPATNACTRTCAATTRSDYVRQRGCSIAWEKSPIASRVVSQLYFRGTTARSAVAAVALVFAVRTDGEGSARKKVARMVSGLAQPPAPAALDWLQ